ncbi:uncharacterized protein ColSpa_00621 [Colletotrichum spaethianum]|uniref:Uncharacterized protein n=1 Tax=Colletotrichum spaethianum TaxID=700344 RepID=A0AA37L5A5_9PEZI|nr:uncharacterized protein ColSpa_00621 [Colletotrichum spaethianum]GKT40440.1 hypothetical protein ColSpa_00621 [Colletotrichum spaethianum]
MSVHAPAPELAGAPVETESGQASSNVSQSGDESNLNGHNDPESPLGLVGNDEMKTGLARVGFQGLALDKNDINISDAGFDVKVGGISSSPIPINQKTTGLS